MKTDRVGLTRRDIQAVDATKLYYFGQPQSEVAEVLYVSRPNVSKLLTRARRRGFVGITVEDPQGRDKEFVNYLKTAFHLAEVRLMAPVSSRTSELHKILGQAGAALLRELTRDDDIIGTAWSRTMGQVAAAMGETEFKDAGVVSLCGNMEDLSIDFSISQGFGVLRKSLNAEVYLVEHPCFFASIAAKQSVIGLDEVRRITEMAIESYIVVYTAGTRTSITHVMADAVSDREQKQHLIEPTVGGICSHFVSANARVCLPGLNARTLSISLPDLRHKEQRALVAGGTDKLEAIYAVLSNGHANRLVTDMATARKLYANHHRLQSE